MPLRVDLSLPRREPTEVIDPSLSSLWRYSLVLPVDIGDAVTLGEGQTPLLEVEDTVWVKDEAQNPTGSFKSRGMALAVSAAVQLDAQRLVSPSAGNAASALAAYGARARIPVGIVMPDDTLAHFVNECRQYGAQVDLVPGTISGAGAFLAANRAPSDLDVSTLKEPCRVEGKKTMGYELFEQFDGDLPDVVLHPTGGGTGLFGMWKAWNEIEEMGWIGAERPRLVSVQTSGCAPIVKAFDEGADRTETWENAATAAWGLRVPGPIGGFICLRAIRETHGAVIAIPEKELHEQMSVLAAKSGIDVCPEGGTVWAAYRQVRDRAWIDPDERVVLFNTETGVKYR